ncbi:hypothetical protein [Paracoccus sp. 22332]|uniref:hypothetical protein n=1 Tax=Paracoccus sp. 22332 TaxID=3453913 RepID=UPI003F86F90A
MTDLSNNTPVVEDRFLDLPAGRIFTRSWTPLGHRKDLAPMSIGIQTAPPIGAQK